MDDPKQNEEVVTSIMPQIQQLITSISVVAMVIGGVVPYIPQYRKIRKTRDSEGFSMYVCFILLLANILRIYFWLGVHYELPLLIQSVVMIATMIAMIQLCVTIRNENSTLLVRRSLLDFNYFWKWTFFSDYLIFIGLFSLIGLVVTLALLNSSIFVQTLGFLSLFTEAMLGMPQFIRNYQNKSTEGMSVQMVMFWTSGDTFKTGYFVLRQAPMQFWMCGALQILVDISILSQVVIYRNNPRQNQNYTIKF